MLPNYPVRWDKEKKAQKKIFFFLLVSVFNQHLISTYYIPGIRLSARETIMNKTHAAPFKGSPSNGQEWGWEQAVMTVTLYFPDMCTLFRSTWFQGKKILGRSSL